MFDEDGTKYLPAAHLIEILSTLPPDSRVMANSVGNLLILSADGSVGVGFVDFVDGEVDLSE